MEDEESGVGGGAEEGRLSSTYALISDPVAIPPLINCKPDILWYSAVFCTCKCFFPVHTFDRYRRCQY